MTFWSVAVEYLDYCNVVDCCGVCCTAGILVVSACGVALGLVTGTCLLTTLLLIIRRSASALTSRFVIVIVVIVMISSHKTSYD